MSMILMTMITSGYSILSEITQYANIIILCTKIDIYQSESHCKEFLFRIKLHFLSHDMTRQHSNFIMSKGNIQIK